MTENNISTSTANHIEKSISDITYTFLGPSICLLSSVICIIGLLTYLKKLHKICKRLLLVLCIHNFICSVITLGILVYMTSSGNQALGICSLLIQVVGPPTYITSENISLLSYIRYHLTWKTANNEAIKKNKLIALCVIVYATEHLCGPIGYLISYLGIPSGASTCAGMTMENDQWPIMPIFQTIKVVLVLAIGIGYDTLLIRFLKKRNQSIGPGQVRLVPWKSSNDSGNSDENNILVPVSATIISLVGIFVIFGIAFSFTQSMIRFGDDDPTYNDNAKGRWKSTVLIFNALMSIRMPVLLGLTIRSAKNKKPAPKIPIGPMFHDDDDDSNSNNTLEEDQEEKENSVGNFQQEVENNENVNAISIISGHVIQETSF